jgi:ligand-binding sensor domain-containing protein/anti-sigma regulatory factor (Ser/Thr protein kinase)
MRYPIIAFLIISSLRLYCQEPAYKQFTVKDGLPGSVVYHSLQDKNGFIWFATSQGVSRFDGRTFRNFTKEDGLPDNDIIKLYLDKNDNVWFVSFIGIPSVYHNGVITRFDQCKGVTSITEDHQSDSIRLFAQTFNGPKAFLGCYTSPNMSGKWHFTASFKESHLLMAEEWPMLRASSPEKINFYFFFKDEKSFGLQVKTAAINKHFSITRSERRKMSVYGRTSFLCLTDDKKGIVFVAGDTIFYADQHKMVAVISLDELKINVPSDICSLYCEDDSTLWISTRCRGLIRIKNFTGAHPELHVFFSKSFCTSTYKDQENGYWITTQGEGVYYLPNLSFYTLSADADITNKNILCIGNGHVNTIAAGFANGNFCEINYLDLSTKKFAGYRYRNENNRILQIWPRQQQHSFLLVCDNGLYRYSPYNVSKLKEMAIKEIVISDTALYIGSSAGVFKLNRSGKESKHLFGDRVTCLTSLSGSLYWGTLYGVYCYSGGSLRRINEHCPALTGIINHIDTAPDSSLWISTQQGLVILKENVATCIKRENGLQSNMCKHVSFSHNIAWVSTDKGIARINYSRQPTQYRYSISTITEEDGLTTNDVNQTTVAGSYIWAVTAKGISYFSKNYTSGSAMPPMININRIVADTALIPVTDSIQLHHSVRKLLIELSGISFASGKQIHYEYRLNGLDSGWSTTLNNSIEFPALPYGQFVFEVHAIDRWNKRSDHPKRIVIFHPPPFAKTTAFLVLTYLLLVLLSGTAFVLFYRRWQRKKEQQYVLKRKVQELEMMALRAQMNPHFIFNCLVSIQYHIMRSDMRNANAYLHKFSTLIRQTLQHSTDSTILLREEIKLLTLYLELEKLRLADRMEYRITVSDELDQDDLSVPTMIVQPYIENAIKHGVASLQNRKGIVTIDIKRSGDYVECIIEDNGPGIYASLNRKGEDTDHASMGTGITIRRMEAINAIQKNKILWQVIDKQQSGLPASGTIVHLSFPVIPS